MKNLAILISFYKFNRCNVQSQLFAALTLGGEKANHPNLRPRCCSLKPSRHIPQSDRLNITFNPPLDPCFRLLRLVPNDTFGNWHNFAGGITKRLTFDQGSSQFDAIQLSLDNQLAAASLTSTAGSSCAAASIDSTCLPSSSAKAS